MYLTFLQEYLVSGLAALFPNALDPDLPDERICINRTELHPIIQLIKLVLIFFSS
jgi:hypothetical protein